MRIELKQVLFPQPKSKIKAGDGKTEGKYKFFTSSPIQSKFVDEANYDRPSLIFGTGGNASVHFCDEPFSTSTDCLVMYGRSKTELETIYNYLKSNIGILENGFKGAGLKHISKEYILAIEIDLPSEEIQLEFLQKNRIIDGLIEAKQAQLHLSEELVKSRFIEMFGDPISNPMGWKTRRFDSLCENLDSRRKPVTASEREAGIYPYYGASGIVDYVADYLFDEDILLVSEDGANLLMRSTPIAFSVSGKVWVNNHAHVVRFEKMSMQKYIEVFFSMIDISEHITGSAQPKLNQAKLNAMMFPVPDDDRLEAFLSFVEQTDKSKYYGELSKNILAKKENFYGKFQGNIKYRAY